MKFKTMYLSRYLLVLICLSSIPIIGYSQDLSILNEIESADSTLYKISTTDGNEFLGTITSVTRDFVELKTNYLGVHNTSHIF